MEFYCAYCNKLREEKEMMAHPKRCASGGFRTIHFCIDNECFSKHNKAKTIRTVYRKSVFSRIHRHY